MSWLDDAACRGAPISVFYPDQHAGPRMYDTARWLCNRCPVRTQCLQEAVDLWDTHGFRGGMTGDERARLSSAVMRTPRRCVVCDERFTPRQASNINCSSKCRDTYHKYRSAYAEQNTGESMHEYIERRRRERARRMAS